MFTDIYEYNKELLKEHDTITKNRGKSRLKDVNHNIYLFDLKSVKNQKTKALIHRTFFKKPGIFAVVRVLELRSKSRVLICIRP